MISKLLIDQTTARFGATQKEWDRNLKLIGSPHTDLNKLNSAAAMDKRMERVRANAMHDSVVRERIIGSNDLFNINHLEKGMRAALSVGRIAIRNANGAVIGHGTGFLVAPGVLMTNNHVLTDLRSAMHSQLEMNYQLDMHDRMAAVEYYRLDPSRLFFTNEKLDFTIVAVASLSQSGRPISEFGFLPLIEETGKVVIGEYLTVIQHPSGMPKQIAMRENVLVKMTDDFLHYHTDTAPGSSGSPVLNDQWEVVALHHSGVPEKNAQNIYMLTDGTVWQSSADDHRIKWIANEGSRVSRIVATIRDHSPASAEAAGFMDAILESTQLSVDVPPLLVTGYASMAPAVTFTGGASALVKQAMPLVAPPVQSKTKPLVRFEIELNPRQEARQLAYAAIEAVYGRRPEPMFAGVNDPRLGNFYELVLPTDSPWDTARSLTAIDGVTDAVPDLPTVGLLPPEEDAPSAEETLLTVESAQSGCSNKAATEAKYIGIQPDWNHAATRFREAIDYSKAKGKLTGHTGIRIAQIDTGYSHHPEINDMKKAQGFDYKANDPIAHDDRGGLSLMPIQWHGTRTGSVIIGKPTGLPNALNEGVFPYVDLVPFRVADSVVLIGTRKHVTSAVRDVVLQGYEIITMSMGGLGYNVWKELARWVYDRGVFWCCAAGNQVRFVVWPAHYPGTIACAATDYKSVPWKGTSRGKAVDISAPGHNVYVPNICNEDRPGNYDYSYGSGTSYATPHVAAAAAIWLNHHRKSIEAMYTQPWQRVEAFRVLLGETARKPSEDWDYSDFGAGILDAEKLLRAGLPDPEKLVHAYEKATVSLTESADARLSVTEREHLHRAWNASAGLPAEPLTERAAALKESFMPTGVDAVSDQRIIEQYENLI
jgi:endonuclease G, mitochondrial